MRQKIQLMKSSIMKKSKSSQLKALFLLLLFVFDLFRPYVISATNSKTGLISGDGPVAESANNYVDPFTGDFHYSVPLMVVPGPNGEAVNVSANYHGGGIRMEEAASWLGLGWDFNPGEISRGVVGTHDDNNGNTEIALETSKSIGLTGISPFIDENNLFGPLYFKNANNAGTTFITATDQPKMYSSTSHTIKKSHDIFSSDFTLAATDNYNVSGPGIGGKIRPFNLGGGLIYRSLQSTSTGGMAWDNTEFNFEGMPINTSNYNYSQHRFQNGYYIKYYNNSDISSNLYNNSTHSGFLDYRVVSGTRRPTSSPSTVPSFDPDGIGGFEITDPSGITYHYSLPVYNLEENAYSFNFDESSNTFLSDTTVIRIKKKPTRYATSWKLTAITGSDYVDVNNNYVVDVGDTGYWIAYDYTLWCNNFMWSSAYYNFNRDVVMSGFSSTKVGNAYLAGNPSPLYSPENSLVKGYSQVYYLNSIKTSSHTAFFIKEIRKDEHSYDKIQGLASSPTPQLKLSKIILLKNDDAALFSNSGTLPSVSGLSTSTCNPLNDNDFIHIGKYSTNSVQIDSKSLKTIVFNTDYSLCPKYFKNINNTFVSVSQNYTYVPIFSLLWHDYYIDLVKLNFNSDQIYASYDYTNTSNYSTSDASNSGKLTLKEIVTYELGKTAIYPSYKFDYTSNNPDYNNKYIDYWGYYKSDFNPALQSKYTTSASASYVDAWSLNKITTPLGGIISVVYESDSYTSAEDGTEGNLPVPFRIKNLSCPSCGSTWNTSTAWTDFEMPEGDDFSSFFNSSDNITAGVGSSSGKAEFILPAQVQCSPNDGTVWTNDYYKGVASGLSQISGSPGHYTHTGTSGGLSLSLISGKDAECSSVSGTLNRNYALSPPFRGYFKVTMRKLYGGGTRVNAITITDPQSNNLSYTSNYTYEGGYCTVQPFTYKYKLSIPAFPTTEDYTLYFRSTSMNESGIGPNVGYSKITVENASNITGQQTGYTVYEYNNILAGKYKNTSPTSCTSYTYANNCLCTGTANHHIALVTYDQKEGFDTYDTPTYGKLFMISIYDRNDVLVSYTKNNYTVQFDPITVESGTDANVHTSYVYFPASCDCATGGSPVYQRIAYQIYINKRAYQRHNGVCFLSSTESFKDGVVSSMSVNTRDNATGQPTSTIVLDPTQGSIETQTQLAYTQSAYSAMGLKSSSTSNQNNLMAVSQTKVIKRPLYRNTGGYLTYDFSDPGKLIGGSKTTYTNQPFYRIYDSGTFHFKTDNSTTMPFWKVKENYELVVDANTLGSSTSLTWRKTGEATAFNNSNQGLLEAKGLNGRYSTAIKMGYNNQYKIADISDASLDCFAFTSFEDGVLSGNTSSYYGGEINETVQQKAAPLIYTIHIGNSNIAFPIPAHTGNYMAKIPPSTFGPTFATINFEKNRTYRASVWVNTLGSSGTELTATLDGTFGSSNSPVVASTSMSDPKNILIGSWMLMTLDITVPSNYTPTGGSLGSNDLRFYIYNADASHTAYADDFSIHPIDAPITGYVYNPLTGWLTATLDNENFATFYTYDQAGRVIKVSKETKNGVKKISETSYHFGRP
jgi:hypothetical protein